MSNGQNQISWIRRRDWHILSSGAQMYTNDERFAILHTPGSNTWTLQIKFVQRRDHGTYECQENDVQHDGHEIASLYQPCDLFIFHHPETNMAVFPFTRKNPVGGNKGERERA
uniref:Immunoglobulin V-set domain-containing protein n=1 Tax=Anopheles culicifacies TaxID=139723 RepID=A0A182MDW0_9DIPT